MYDYNEEPTVSVDLWSTRQCRETGSYDLIDSISDVPITQLEDALSAWSVYDSSRVELGDFTVKNLPSFADDYETIMEFAELYQKINPKYWEFACLYYDKHGEVVVADKVDDMNPRVVDWDEFIERQANHRLYELIGNESVSQFVELYFDYEKFGRESIHDYEPLETDRVGMVWLYNND